MERKEVFNVNNRPRYNFKKYPFVSLLDDPIGEFLQVLENVLHVEDIRSYIHCEIKSIGDTEIHKELEKICNNDLSLKPEYTYLEQLNLVKHMFYTDLDNHEWTRIILRKVHDDLLWLGNLIICINNDLIQKVTGLRNEGCIPINIKNVRKLVETNLNTSFDGRNMKINTIQDDGVRFINKFLGYKVNHGSRIDSVPT